MNNCGLNSSGTFSTKLIETIVGITIVISTNKCQTTNAIITKAYPSIDHHRHICRILFSTVFCFEVISKNFYSTELIPSPYFACMNWEKSKIKLQWQHQQDERTNINRIYVITTDLCKQFCWSAVCFVSSQNIYISTNKTDWNHSVKSPWLIYKLFRKSSSKTKVSQAVGRKNVGIKQ